MPDHMIAKSKLNLRLENDSLNTAPAHKHTQSFALKEIERKKRHEARKKKCLFALGGFARPSAHTHYILAEKNNAHKSINRKSHETKVCDLGLGAQHSLEIKRD